ncbi:hypothetical protein [Azospirillum agricola]|uniref:hypothetical protein n=1 Tax=Azospirillum agricola TaxID=1720247 RepID=UPI0015C48456|nr:hypothetical protein [Azospirillum agricola]
MTTIDAGPDDAPLERAPEGGSAELVLAGLLAAAVETAGFATAAATAIPHALPAAVALHLAVCGGLAVWVRSRLRRGLDLRLAGLMLVTTPVLGPLGPLFTLAAAALHALFRRYATGFQDWYLSLFPDSEVEPARELYELIVSGRETSHLAAGESFTDVMSVGSPQQKQAVIALVARPSPPPSRPGWPTPTRRSASRPPPPRRGSSTSSTSAGWRSTTPPARTPTTPAPSRRWPGISTTTPSAGCSTPTARRKSARRRSPATATAWGWRPTTTNCGTTSAGCNRAAGWRRWRRLSACSVPGAARWGGACC